jgi:predicted transcriptional regulator
MMLTLTLTNKRSGFNKDIQINSQQRIIDTLKILEEAGILSGLYPEKIKVKSVRKGIYVNSKETYEKEHINTGDILELV